MATTMAAGNREGRAPGGWTQAAVLILLLAICAVVEYAAAVVTRPAVATWYQDIQRPAWTPPDMAFPIVWTTLYVLMALAAWQAWRRVPHAAAGALIPFLIQLALNAAWSYAFFGYGNFPLGFVVLVALVLAVLATITAFAQRSGLAAWLMAPYLVWICYAAALNARIVQLNPQI
mgnify:CR=1 FL=1